MKLKRLLYKYKNIQKNKSVFFIWILSYTLILIIPVVFCGIVYVIASKEFKNEVNRSSIATLKQMQVAIDSTLSEAQRLSINITNNRKAFKAAGFRTPLQSSEHYAISELLTDLKGYNMTSSSINSFYIYFKESDTVISPVTFGSSKEMHQVLGHEKLMHYEEWQAMLRKQHTMQCTPILSEDEAGRSSMMVAFLQSIPINAPQDSLGTVVVLIDVNKLMEMAINIHGADAGDVLIINKNNEVLAATRSYTDGSLPLYEDLKGESGVLYMELEGKKVSLFYNTSEISKLKYIELVPQNVIHKKNIKIRTIMSVSILLCLFIGGIAAVLLASKNYNPVRELLKFLADSNSTVNINKQHNEYYLIQEVLRSTIHEKERLSKRVVEQNLTFKTSFLEKLIKGKIEHKENTLDILSSLGINFYSEYFAVILFYIEDFGDYFLLEEGEDPKKRTDTVKFVFKNVVEEISGQNHMGIMIEVDDMMACLINFKPEGVKDAKQELHRIAEETRECIGNKLHIGFVVAVSGIHHMLGGIPEAWEEANEAMEYRFVDGERKLFQYEDRKIFSQNYSYPLEMEYKLVNCIKSGDSSTAGNIVNEIFDTNFSKPTLSLQMAKCLMYDLVSTIIKTTEELSNTYHIPVHGETEMIGKILNCRTLPCMKNMVIKIIVEICMKVQEGRKSQSYRMSDSIAEYIKENFHNANLGLSMIAEHFEITPTYVSRIFKEQTGEGILDYINRVRLDKAKELLKNGEFNITAVSEKVGYANSRGLIRLFKKYEGITPGQYKEI